MTSSQSAASSTVANGLPALVDRHYFLFRRLHSLTGIFPIGVFLLEHLFTNSQILRGPAEFNHDIDFSYGLPGLLMMEIFGIWLPIAFHAALGMVYVFGGKPNNAHYRYSGNVRYTLMRTTGVIALVYIFFHVATLRWGWNVLGWYTPFEPGNNLATPSTARALQFAWWVPVFYLIGTLSIVFHFANGLWTSAITWGLTVSVAAQRRWGYICAILGVALALMGVASIFKFYTIPLT